MAQTKLQLDTRRPLKDGTCPVRVCVGHGTDLYLPTGVYLRPSDWNARAQMATGRNAAPANRALTAILSRAVSRCLELRERGLWGRLTRSQLKAMLKDTSLSSPPDGTPKGMTLGAMFRKVMGEKKPQTAAQYAHALARIASFCDPDALPLAMVTPAWTERFALSLKGLKPNTRAGYAGCLKAVMAAAARAGLADDRAARALRERREDTRMRDLSAGELRRLRDLPLRGEAAEARDMFMLSFYLIGINAADLCALTPASVVNGRLEYRRAKTSRRYSVLLEREALSIIERHRGKSLLLDSCERLGGRAAAFSHWLSGHARKWGVRDDLTLYFARYTWATLAASLDIPMDTISEALGHAHGSRVTGIYVQFAREKVDAANRRVIDFVNGE